MRTTLHVRFGRDQVQVARIDVEDHEPVIERGAFSSSRLLIADFLAAEQTLKNAVKRAGGLSWFTRPPIVVVQPEVDLEGGVSPVENRILLEIVEEGCAAERVYVHESASPLSRVECLALAQQAKMRGFALTDGYSETMDIRTALGLILMGVAVFGFLFEVPLLVACGAAWIAFALVVAARAWRKGNRVSSARVAFIGAAIGLTSIATSVWLRSAPGEDIEVFRAIISLASALGLIGSVFAVVLADAQQDVSATDSTP
jgi:hypothetical protein